MTALPPLSLSSLQSVAPNVSPYAVCCIAGNDSASDSAEFSDSSGSGLSLMVQKGNTAPFSVPGYFSSIAGTDSGLSIPAALWSWNPATDSLIVAFTLYKGIPSASQAFFAMTCSGGGAVGSGFYLSHRTDGGILIVPMISGVVKSVIGVEGDAVFSDDTTITTAGTWTGSSGATYLTYSTALPAAIVVGCGVSGTNVATGTTVTGVNAATNTITLSAAVTGAISAAALTIKNPVQPRHCVVAYDAPSGSFYLFREGVAIGYWPAVLQRNALSYASGSSTYPVCWASGSAAADQAYAASGANLQIYKFAGAHLPHNIGLIAKKLFQRPGEVLPAAFMETSTKRVYLTIGPGQSNEAGAGGGGFLSGAYKSRNAGRGAPVVDPPPATGATVSGGLTMGPGGGNSWWPKLAALAGARGVWLETLSGAFGSTSLCEIWVGCCFPWVAGVLVSSGAICTYNGVTYKATTANCVTFVTTGAGHTPDGAGGTDAGLTWTSLGASVAVDVAGHVYTEADGTTYDGGPGVRFDPNGLLRNTYYLHTTTPLAAGGSLIGGYDLHATYCSIGQGDCTNNGTSWAITQAIYQAALISAANYFTSRGITFIMGTTFTNSVNGGPIVSAQSPARAAALTSLAANSRVKAGADLAISVGVLPNETTPQPAAFVDYPAIQNNGSIYVHANAAAMALAAQYINTALATAGI